MGFTLETGLGSRLLQRSFWLENLAMVGRVEGHWYLLTRTWGRGTLGPRVSGDERLDNGPLRRGPQREEKAPLSFRGDAKDGLEALAAVQGSKQDSMSLLQSGSGPLGIFNFVVSLRCCYERKTCEF